MHPTIDTTDEDPELVAAVREAQQTLDRWHELGRRLGVPIEADSLAQLTALTLVLNAKHMTFSGMEHTIRRALVAAYAIGRAHAQRRRPGHGARETGPG
jgi:hypothetical protein